MTIAFLLQDTGSVYGAERATLDLACGLRSRGIDVRVLLIQETRLGLMRSVLYDAFVSAGFSPVNLPCARRFSRALILLIRQFCQVEKIEVLHTVGYKADLHGGLASVWGRQFPIVATVHGWLFRFAPKELFFQWLDLQCLKKFTRVIALSTWYRCYLEQHQVATSVYIPSGLDPAELVPESLAEPLWDDPAAPFTFGMLGRLSSEKNQVRFIHACKTILSECASQALHFIIAGAGPDRGRLESLIRREGLADVVRLTGYLSSAEFFRQVHVLVQCSRMENLPYSVLEAMAWKRPVLASQVGGLPDLVVPGESGMLFPLPQWAQQLPACMRQLVDHPCVARDWGAAGRRLLAQRFSYRAMLDHHLQVYQSMMGSQSNA